MVFMFKQRSISPLKGIDNNDHAETYCTMQAFVMQVSEIIINILSSEVIHSILESQMPSFLMTAVDFIQMCAIAVNKNIIS